jgi:ferredoxin
VSAGGSKSPARDTQVTMLRIGIVYFSCTDVTTTYAEHIAGSLEQAGCIARLINITPLGARHAPPPLEDLDGVVFGFPVFADFAPLPVHDWLPTLQGNGRPCALFVTYGARTSGYAHFHTSELLAEAGFRVLFSAEFLGRHSFNVAGWEILPDRPDDDDLAVAGEFAALAVERFSDPASTPIQFQKPFGYDQATEELANRESPDARSWTNPVRTTETCTMCRRCEEECPTGSFDADGGKSDISTCISCMRCVYICPDEVITVDQRMHGAYEEFKRWWRLTEEMMRAKRSKILTESWQASS